MATITIDNFSGRLTRIQNGTMNSGLAKYNTTFGNDPFSSPGNLTWLEAPTQIDSGGTTITDLIVAAKARLESGVTYVYAIGHTGRLYKIQVNNTSTYNPNYDNPVLLATLSAQSPTFKFGSSMQFYGSTERIYIGHDVGVTQINFDGTGETFVGSAGSWTQNVPRPSATFAGVMYWGNGNNIAAIDTTLTVTSYTKLSPGFNAGTFTRDMHVSPDGTYLQMVVSEINSADLTSATQDTNSLSSGVSYIYFWNGSDVAATSFNQFNGYAIATMENFGQFNYALGYDLGGAAVYSSGQKILSLPLSLVPNLDATFSTGNLLGFLTPEQDTSSNTLKGSLMFYGQYDEEIPQGLFRLLRKAAISTETDVIQVPTCLIVSNLFLGSSSAGYTKNQVGSAKLYFSTLETSSAPTTKYRFYQFTTVPTGTGTSIGGVYETQQQQFAQQSATASIGKKFSVTEVRVYTENLVTNNSFKIDLIDPTGNVVANASQTFTVGTNVSAGTDLVQYNPTMAPVHSLGVRITNLGSANWVGTKIELDVKAAGK